MRLRSAVLQSLAVWSAEVVASIVESGLKTHLMAYLLCAVNVFLGSGTSVELGCINGGC
jgi:ribosomal protein L30E